MADVLAGDEMEVDEESVSTKLKDDGVCTVVTPESCDDVVDACKADANPVVSLEDIAPNVAVSKIDASWTCASALAEDDDVLDGTTTEVGWLDEVDDMGWVSVADEKSLAASLDVEVADVIKDSDEVDIKEDVGSSVLDGSRPVITRKRLTFWYLVNISILPRFGKGVA